VSTAEFVNRLPVLLRPNPASVVIRPYMPSVEAYKYAAPDRPRAQRIADPVLALDATALHDKLERILQDFSGRHRDASSIFRRRFREVDGIEICKCQVNDEQAVLIGAHFCNEYSYEAAALFNPSIVAHPNQAGLPVGSSRLVLSLRFVGEVIGNVSDRDSFCRGCSSYQPTQPKTASSYNRSRRRPSRGGRVYADQV
jgi:hypothetical protein